MSDGRRRCRRCRYTFHDFSGRWIDAGNISCVLWLKIIKLFELEHSIRKAGILLGTSYDTVYKAVTTIRLAIAAHSEDDMITAGCVRTSDLGGAPGEGGETRGPGASEEISVFGLRERKGRVFSQIVPSLRPETIPDLLARKNLGGGIVYTDSYMAFDSLIFYHHRRVSARKDERPLRGAAYRDGLEGFLSYVKDRMEMYHGVSSHRFPLYLKELEFRFNHRKEDIFPIIVEYLCDLRPQSHTGIRQIHL